MSFFSRLVPFALRIGATAGIALKRLLTQRLLSLASIAGLMIASGFILSVPLYADGTYFRLLREEILAGNELELQQKPVDYAPLAFVFELNAPGRDSPQWKKVVNVDNYLSSEAPRRVDLPILQVIRRFHTDSYHLFPPRDLADPSPQYWLTPVSFATITPMDASTIQLVNGSYPRPYLSLLKEG